MTTSAEIEACLAPLVGLPLWGITRAATLESFQFGPRRLVTRQAGPRAGTQKEVGSHALHVQCAWRICGRDGALVRSDAGVQAFVQNVCPIQVVAVRADAGGGVRIDLEHGYVVEVCPAEHEAGEKWRFFSPYESSAHAVFEDGQLRGE